MTNQLTIFKKSGTWSQSEKDILIQEIEKTPNNLSNAFERAGEMLGRTSGSCSQRYYRELKHQYNIIGLSSVEGKVVNIKNTPTSKDDPADLRFQVILASLHKLKRSEKEAILQHILNL